MSKPLVQTPFHVTRWQEVRPTAGSVDLAQWSFSVPQARISNWSAAAVGGDAERGTAFPPPPTVFDMHY